MSNSVFIATSLDGFIADKECSVDWLHMIPNPDGDDMGYEAFVERIDAMVMGRNTLDMVLSFGVDWPYTKPVFVLSNTLTSVPAGYEDKIFLLKGDIKDVVEHINALGFKRLYIDGGVTIQQFMQSDMIDELIITTIPVVLGGGSRLFGDLDAAVNFKLLNSEVLLDTIVQNQFVRAS
ncbi:dihydrofolate reductase family protein [Moritella sp. F3]|uniref:dihydrofolate reductase family protein n=1 Tax=Moritella sp. F3 TaxID=2718882 RepID=UPI0018E0D0D1|nr:dihydrofolate reductase family protein [Moritella sp. F3]GIC75310.1 diacylglycerol kinase [Moritella sp. F1]GIC80455.1 diacylglycerol kinase [Moritella sp. F3]